MNFKKISLTSSEIPQPTSSHGLVSLLNEPTVVMFGGMQSDYKRKNPTWTFDTGKFLNFLKIFLDSLKFNEAISGMEPNTSVEKKGMFGKFGDLFITKKQVPEARERHTLSVLDGNRVLLFGGMGDLKKRFNDVWILSTIPNKYNWYKPKIISKELPSERYNHTCSVYESNLILFGG